MASSSEPWLNDPIVGPAPAAAKNPWEADPVVPPAELTRIPGMGDFAKKQAHEYLGKIDQLAAADPEVRPKVQQELGVKLPGSFEEFYAQTAPIYRESATKRLYHGVKDALFGNAKPEPVPNGIAAGTGAEIEASVRKVPLIGNLVANAGNLAGSVVGDLATKLEGAADETHREMTRPKSWGEHVLGVLGGSTIPGLSLVPGFGTGGGATNRNLILGAGRAAGGLGEQAVHGATRLGDMAVGDPARLIGGSDAEEAAMDEARRDFNARSFRESFVAPVGRALRDFGGQPDVQSVGETGAGFMLPLPLSLRAGEKGAAVGKAFAERIPTFIGEAVSDAGANLSKAAAAAPAVSGVLAAGSGAATGGSFLGAHGALGGMAAGGYYGAKAGQQAAPYLTRAGEALMRTGESLAESPALRANAAAAGQAVGQLSAAGLAAGEGALLGGILAPPGQEREGAEGMMGFSAALAPLAMYTAGKTRRSNELQAVRTAYADAGRKMSYGETLDAQHAEGTAGLDAPTLAEIDVARGVLGSIAPDGRGRRLVVLAPDRFAEVAQSVQNQAGIDAAAARGFFREGDGTVVVNRGQIRGPESIRSTIEHEGGHALWDAFSKADPAAAEPIRAAILGQIIDATGEPTDYLRRFAESYGGDTATPEGLKRAAGYLADELLAQTGASLGVFGSTGRLIKPPELSERVSDAITNALVRRNPERVDLRIDGPLSGGRAVGVNPEVQGQLRDAFAGQVKRGASPLFDPNLRAPELRGDVRIGTGVRLPDPDGEPLGITDLRETRPPAGPLSGEGLPTPTPASVPDAAPQAITRPLSGGAPLPVAREPKGGPLSGPAEAPSASPAASVTADAVSALQRLGIAKTEAQRRVEEALKAGTFTDAGELVKEALRSRGGPLSPPPKEAAPEPAAPPAPPETPLPAREVAPPAAESKPRPDPTVSPMSEDAVIQAERSFQPSPYKPRGTPEEQAAKIEARRQQELDAELWRQHAEALQTAGDDGRVTARKDERTGQTVVRGKFFVPGDAVHDRILARNPEVAAETLSRIQEAIDAGLPVTVDYFSAAPTREARTAAARAEAQAASSAKDRAAGETPGVVADKAILPSGFVVSKDGKVSLRGFSVDKFTGNAEKLLRIMGDAGIPLPFESVNDPRLVEAFNAYVQNHRAGWKGDGSAKLRATEGVRVPDIDDPTFEPTKLPREVADFINLALANEGAKAKGPRGQDAREFSAANEGPLSGDGEVNPLRARLNESGMLKEGPIERVAGPLTGGVESIQEQDRGSRNVLEPTSETINADLILRLKEGAPTPEGTNLRATEFKGERGAVVESGAPRADFVAAGFLPAKKYGPLSGRQEEVDVRPGSGRVRGPLSDLEPGMDPAALAPGRSIPPRPLSGPLGDAENVAAARFLPKRITPEQDREYLRAVEAGDMEAAQRMVDAAAERAGYKAGPYFHGGQDGERFAPR